MFGFNAILIYNGLPIEEINGVITLFKRRDADSE